MRKLGFHVEKGGTGKTTVSGNTAHELSRYKKTVLVDCDPQGNLTSWFVNSAFKRELADILSGTATVRETALPLRENLDIIPTFAIGGNLKPLSETILFQKPYIFADFVDALENAGYELAIFDLGPGISNLEKSVISVMDEVIGVVTAEYFSVDGMEIFEHELETIRRDRRGRFTATKLVINRVNRSYAFHRQYLEGLEKRGYQTFVIGQSTDISDCVVYHQSLLAFAPGNRYTSEFLRLAQALL